MVQSITFAAIAPMFTPIEWMDLNLPPPFNDSRIDFATASLTTSPSKAVEGADPLF
jgi:hypothetical protein